MESSVSVRIDKPEMAEVERVARLESKSKSMVVREALQRGLQDKRIAFALEKFRKHEATAWKAATLAGIPLSSFLDMASAEGLEVHYTLKELEEDIGGIQ